MRCSRHLARPCWNRQVKCPSLSNDYLQPAAPRSSCQRPLSGSSSGVADEGEQHAAANGGSCRAARMFLLTRRQPQGKLELFRELAY